MTETLTTFLERIDRLGKRFENDSYTDSVLMPLDLLIAVRDEIRQPGLFTKVIREVGGERDENAQMD